jgi:uncharacterized lipoprotein NlpE involved in copper resistance
MNRTTFALIAMVTAFLITLALLGCDSRAALVESCVEAALRQPQESKFTNFFEYLDAKEKVPSEYHARLACMHQAYGKN